MNASPSWTKKQQSVDHLQLGAAVHYIHLASGGQQSKRWDLFRRRKQSVEAAHLKVIQANDTVSMRNITFSQDFFCFLQEKIRGIKSEVPLNAEEERSKEE